MTDVSQSVVELFLDCHVVVDLGTLDKEVLHTDVLVMVNC